MMESFSPGLSDHKGKVVPCKENQPNSKPSGAGGKVRKTKNKAKQQQQQQQQQQQTQNKPKKKKKHTNKTKATQYKTTTTHQQRLKKAFPSTVFFPSCDPRMPVRVL
jgi:predicted alpha/beta superfamily hydrolase